VQRRLRDMASSAIETCAFGDLRSVRRSSLQRQPNILNTLVTCIVAGLQLCRSGSRVIPYRLF